MIIIENMKSLSLFVLFLYCFCLGTTFGSDAETTITPEVTTTPEPEASVGCPPPDLKLSRPRKYGSVGGLITTEIPYVTFETTQIYLPEDFTTADFEFIENIEHTAERTSQIENIHRPYSSDINSYDENDDDDVEGDMDQINRRSRYTDFNPYSREDSDDNPPAASSTHGNNKANRKNTRRHSTRRRTFDSHHRTSKRDIHIFDQDIHDIYMQSADLTSNLLSTINQHGDEHDDKLEISHKITNNLNESKFNLSFTNNDFHNNSATHTNEEDLSKDELFNLQPNNDQALNNGDTENKEQHNRVKRKSGKTTGALSRPKADSGSSSAKSTSRKTQAGVDEDSGGFPLSPDEFDSKETDEEHKEPHDHSQFSEVSEVRFPGEVGPLGERRLCKIKCIKGKWIGPLCASQDDTVADGTGLGKFQPLYKNCRVTRIPPHLLLSYKNVSVTVGWDLPHGHSLQARCKDLGMYKLLGESRVLCSNGLWAPRMPSCVPTTLLTNYSDDSPPSIRIKIGIGSGAFEPSGVLAVLPGSTLHLDCMYPRRRGTPEWTWTGWFRQYITGWSTVPEEKATRYRLTIKDIQNQDSGTFTCASPRGLTNSVVIVVAISQCPNMPEAKHPLSLRLEGNKLGQKALYRCPLGYIIKGTANATCLASGNWSSPPPTCHPVQCPPLQLEDAHLSLVELNASAWGRAVFRCSWGYRLTGPPGLECEPTGVWSGPIPRCRAIQCPQPLVPINGRIDGTSGSSSISHRRYAVGALVTFSCTEGHLLVGEASIVCTETGFWSHPPPFCKAQCPYPGDPSNGLIAPLKFHYDPGDYLSVQCRPGFVEYGLNGPPERPRCLPDGNWSGPVPQCRNYEEV